MAAALNLSNEVVKMRAEVKRVKVLVLRKLTRQVSVLKIKKGTEADLERNRRRAARLLEEVRLLKALAPDVITKTALQRDISFQKVCQNKDASLEERATARVAAHPDFSKKIQSIKSAVAAFKAERTGADKKRSAEPPRDGDQEESDPGLGQEESDPGLGQEEDEEESEDEEAQAEQISTAEKQEQGELTEQNEEAPITTEQRLSDHIPPEVPRMRKEVKKLRILIIRKLTQEITGLKKATAEDPEHKGNPECVPRLRKEVQVLRGLQPDFVTRRALEGNADLEKALQDPESSPEERAAARIATHPRFVNKLRDVRVAIEEEKTKAAKAEEKNRTKREERGMTKGEADEEEQDRKDSDDDDNGRNDADARKPQDIPLKHPVEPKSAKKKPPTPKSHSGETKNAIKSPDGQRSDKTFEKPEVTQSGPSKTKGSGPAPKQASQPATEKQENTVEDDSESDLSDSEDEQEKEYFDDSTEERFHKQSSLSEQSDGDDDFFLGKVSKFKKKRSSSGTPGKDRNDSEKPAHAEDASKPGRAARFRMQSVFCSALSSSGSPQTGKTAGPKPPRFQNQRRSDGKPSWFKSQDSGTDKRQSGNRACEVKERGPGRAGLAGERRGQQAKPAFDRQGNKPGRPSQQALHPSWEASRKRKEQQAQITAFQGKKIKFDLDD